MPDRLSDLNYDPGRVVALLGVPLPVDETDEAVQKHLEALVVAVPEATATDLAALGLLRQLLGDLYNFKGRSLKALVEITEPFGSTAVGSDATIGEVVDAVPDDWSEADRLRRLVVTVGYLASMLGFFGDMTAQRIDWDDEYEWAKERPLWIPPFED